MRWLLTLMMLFGPMMGLAAIGPAAAPVFSPDGRPLFNDFRPAVAPDGQTLVFQSKRSGAYHLYRMPAAGGEVETVTEGDWNDASPSWAPDGERLAFYSDRDGGAGDIYVLEVETGAVTRLTIDESLDYAPSWPPDGPAIAFVSQRSGQSRIYLMGTDGSQQTLLLDGCDAVP